MILGIDVGNKKSTQGVLLDGKQFIVLKDKGYTAFDSGKSLFDICKKYPLEVVAIDAPLSVPSSVVTILEGGIPVSESPFDRGVDARMRKKLGMSMPWGMLSIISIKGIMYRNIIQNYYDSIDILEAYPAPFVKGFMHKKGEHEQEYCLYVQNKMNELGFSIDGVISTHDIADAAIAALIGERFLGNDEKLCQVKSGRDIVYYLEDI